MDFEGLLEGIKPQIILLTMNDDTDFIYKIDWFKTRRHKLSHTTQYLKNPKDVEWVFESQDWLNDLARVEYIKVSKSSKKYEMAVFNSLPLEEKKKIEEERKKAKEDI